MKKVPWYKRLFGIQHTETEYCCSVTYEVKHIWEETGSDQLVAVYRDFIPETGETVRLYGIIPRFGTRYYSVDAYNKEGRLIEI